MVSISQSTRMRVAGPPTSVVRKPLAGIPPFSSPSAVVAPPRLPRGLSMVPACPIKPRHFVAGPTLNETNGTHCRYKNAFAAYDECQPLTKAKLTRSCAGPNPGAITYTQFTTDIALEETGRCKRLALEHHKWHRRWTSEARNVGSHPRPPAKRNGDAPSQLPLQTLCVTGIPSPRPFPVKARGSYWLASGSVPGTTSGPC